MMTSTKPTKTRKRARKKPQHRVITIDESSAMAIAALLAERSMAELKIAGNRAAVELAAAMRPTLEAVRGSAAHTASDLKITYDSIVSTMRSLENTIKRTHPDDEMTKQLASGAEYLMQCAQESKVPTWPVGDVAFREALVEARKLGLLAGRPGVFPAPANWHPDRANRTREALAWVLGKQPEDETVRIVEACIALVKDGT